ncbi:hypothetical protein RCIA119 [Methanocella arvoryzae MRE50]|uniref:Uncharacterized protein n=1 Tax=Methanocella arvoryzae (strain DSM 22066 / NBRC 105507 / MRE50) TaxID=351160 RepID=Q0W4E6_METAR|nr:hypothetical protein RCIA119 [Methanocella arvoryzae MRE50]
MCGSRIIIFGHCAMAFTGERMNQQNARVKGGTGGKEAGQGGRRGPGGTLRKGGLEVRRSGRGLKMGGHDVQRSGRDQLDCQAEKQGISAS